MPDKSQPIDLATVHGQIEVPYWNEALASINDHEVRMSVMTEPFGWHSHPDSDESFLVLEGQLVIGFESGDVVLGPGQLLTVPRGVLHRTQPFGERSVNLTFKRRDADTVFVELQDS